MVNHTVAKFMNNVDANCSFCNLTSETIQHLFYYCPISMAFIVESIHWFNRLGTVINIADLDVYDFLFIQRSRTRNHSHFVIFLHIKYFLWLSRCNKSIPTLDNFKKWVAKEFNLLTECISNFNNLDFIIPLALNMALGY